MANKTHLKIITPYNISFDDEIEKILLTATSGEIVIMANHAPITFILEECIVKIINNENKFYLTIMGGSVEVLNNNITIITDAAENPDQIDVDRARYSKSRAERRIDNKNSSEIDIERAQRSLRRAEIRIKLGVMKR